MTSHHDILVYDIISLKSYAWDMMSRNDDGRCTGVDKMSKVFHFWVNSTILKRISNSIQNFTGFGAFNTIKSQWSGGRVQVQVQVFSLSL